MKLEDTRPKRGGQHLGRGLAALFGEESEEETGFERLRQSRMVPVEFLHPSRLRSEDRRVGKECRPRRSPYH